MRRFYKFNNSKEKKLEKDIIINNDDSFGNKIKNKLDDNKEIKKLENINNLKILKNENILLDELNDDDDEDEYFKQPLMRVHRLSLKKKELGRIRRSLILSEEKLKKREKPVSINKEKAEELAIHYFLKRRKLFHEGRLNQEKTKERNKSVTDFFYKNEGLRKKIINSNFTDYKTNLTVFKDNKKNDEEKIENKLNNKKHIDNDINNDNNSNNNDIKNKDKKINYIKIEENHEEKGNETKYNEGKNIPKIEEKENLQNEDEKKKNKIFYRRREYKINKEEKEKNENLQNNQIKVFIRKKDNKDNRLFKKKKNYVYKDKESEEKENTLNNEENKNKYRKDSKYLEKDMTEDKQKEEEKDNKINYGNNVEKIRVRRHQRIITGIAGNEKNENHKKEKRKKEDFTPKLDKKEHSFYHRHKIFFDNNKIKDNIEDIINISSPKLGFTSPKNGTNSFLKKPFKLSQPGIQIPLNNYTNNNKYKISETPKENQNISYKRFIRNFSKDNSGNRAKEKVKVITRGHLQINTGSFIRNDIYNKGEDNNFENKYKKYNETPNRENNKVIHTIQTEGNIRPRHRREILDNIQVNDQKYDNKDNNKNYCITVNANYNNRKNNNGTFSTITVNTVNRKKVKKI